MPPSTLKKLFPAAVVAKNAALGILRTLQGSRSQFGQDRWVLQMLKGKRGGYFVDIGAFDGMNLSNTYVLEKNYEWMGICIEPSQPSFELLQKNRDCIADSSCVYGSEKEIDFIDAKEYGGIQSTLTTPYTDLLEKCLGIDHDSIVPSKKKTTTIASLLKKYQAPSIIDYLSIDTQGSEYDILTAFPFEVHHCLTMTIEHWNQTKERDFVRELLRSHGYVLKHEHKYEDWYCHPGILS
jgi:FkbM family methyltransferase